MVIPHSPITFYLSYCKKYNLGSSRNHFIENDRHQLLCTHEKTKFLFAFALHLLLFSYRGDRTRPSNSESKIDHTDFTDCVAFLTSNLMEDLSTTI